MEMKNKINRSIQICLLLCIILTVGCAKLPVEKSYWNSSYYDADQFSGYDDKSKLRWKVSNDSKNLSIVFDTYEKKTIGRILRGGIKVYFDTTGKEKQEHFLACRGTDISLPRLERKFNSGQDDNDAASLDYSADRKSMSGTFKEATLKYGEDEFTYDILLDRPKLVCTYDYDVTGRLICNLGLPLNMINHKGFNAIKKLSLGIFIGSSVSSRVQTHDGDNPEGYTNRGGGMGGMRGGGMGGHSGGMGGARMGGSHGRGYGGGQSNNQEPIKIWFKTQLETPPKEKSS
jgi:hypothetical protein